MVLATEEFIFDYSQVLFDKSFGCLPPYCYWTSVKMTEKASKKRVDWRVNFYIAVNM